MAYGDTFHPAGTSRDVKVRGPLWVGIWSFVTLGIYAVYWFYVAAKDLSEYGKAKGHDLGQRPVMTLLALTLGWLLLFIPPLVAMYRFTRRAQQAQRLAGRTEALNGWLALALIIVFSPAYDAYVQSELNKAWAAEGGPVPIDDGTYGQPLPAGQAQPAGAAAGAPATQELSSPERPAE